MCIYIYIASTPLHYNFNKLLKKESFILPIIHFSGWQMTQPAPERLSDQLLLQLFISILSFEISYDEKRIKNSAKIRQNQPSRLSFLTRFPSPQRYSFIIYQLTHEFILPVLRFCTHIHSSINLIRYINMYVYHINSSLGCIMIVEPMKLLMRCLSSSSVTSFSQLNITNDQSESAWVVIINENGCRMLVFG